MPHLIESAQKTVRGAKDLGEQAELELYSSLRDSVNDWFNEVNAAAPLDDILLDLRKKLMRWEVSATENTQSDIMKLFELGYKAGMKKAKVEVPSGFIGDVEQNIFSEKGIIPAIENFQNEVFDKISNIVQKHYTSEGLPLYRAKRNIDSYLRDARGRTRLMLRSEIAKMSNWGMLKAYNLDENRFLYNYYWINPSDVRSKEISLLRKEGNPYNFDTIKFLWEHQEEQLDGKWMTDNYNNRCSIYRGERLDKEWNGNIFASELHRFRRTL